MYKRAYCRTSRGSVATARTRVPVSTIFLPESASHAREFSLASALCRFFWNPRVDSLFSEQNRRSQSSDVRVYSQDSKKSCIKPKRVLSGRFARGPSRRERRRQKRIEAKKPPPELSDSLGGGLHSVRKDDSGSWGPGLIEPLWTAPQQMARGASSKAGHSCQKPRQRPARPPR